MIRCMICIRTAIGAASPEHEIRAALEKAEMPFAPSLPTWARQADLLAKGDMEAFKKLTDELTAGRDESKKNEGGQS